MPERSPPDIIILSSDDKEENSIDSRSRAWKRLLEATPTPLPLPCSMLTATRLREMSIVQRPAGNHCTGVETTTIPDADVLSPKRRRTNTRVDLALIQECVHADLMANIMPILPGNTLIPETGNESVTKQKCDGDVEVKPEVNSMTHYPLLTLPSRLPSLPRRATLHIFPVHPPLAVSTQLNSGPASLNPYPSFSGTMAVAPPKHPLAPRSSPQLPAIPGTPGTPASYEFSVHRRSPSQVNVAAEAYDGLSSSQASAMSDTLPGSSEGADLLGNDGLSSNLSPAEFGEFHSLANTATPHDASPALSETGPNVYMNVPSAESSQITTSPGLLAQPSSPNQPFATVSCGWEHSDISQRTPTPSNDAAAAPMIITKEDSTAASIGSVVPDPVMHFLEEVGLSPSFADALRRVGISDERRIRALGSLPKAAFNIVEKSLVAEGLDVVARVLIRDGLRRRAQMGQGR